MILRLSNAAQRAALVVVSFSAAIILSYFSIRNAVSVHYADLQTAMSLERATRLEPANPQNWYLLGRYLQYSLEDPDPQRTIRSYLTALSLNPGSWETWLDLATAYESESDFAAARNAFLHAKHAYPLSPDVSWRYGNFLLRQGELAPAFTEMRHTVEVEPKRSAEAFSRSLHAGADIQTVLDRVLPPISEAYLPVIWDQTTEGHTDTALKVWDRLASLYPRISLNDSSSLVGALRAEKRIAEARRVWDQAVVLAGFTGLLSPSRSLLWDGGFESGVYGGGYAWLLPEAFRGVQIGFDKQEKHSGDRSLRLIFDGKSNVSFVGVCHYVPVEPSTSYRFSAWVRTRSLVTDQGIRFQLHSLGIQDTSVVVTPEFHGNLPWTIVEMPWTSGKDVQELQVCLARYPSEDPDHKIRGTAWVDDVALIPEGAGQSNP